MYAFEFVREVGAGEDLVLDSIGSFLLGKADITLQVSCGQQSRWILTFPDSIRRIPDEIKFYGKTTDNIDSWHAKYWVTRPLLLQDRAAEIAGSQISTFQDFPLEDLLAENNQFHFAISIRNNPRIPRSRNGVLVSISIQTDSYEVAKQIARAFNGRVNDKECLTLAYASELKYLIRPPISTHAYHSGGVLTYQRSINDIFRNDRSLLTKHCLICGKTGSGKTNTAKIVLDQILQGNNQDCKVLVLDNKGEYRPWAKKNKIKFYEIGENPNLLRMLKFNPFRPGKNVKLSNHLEILSMILSVSGFTGSGIILPEYMKFVLYYFFMDLWNIPKDKFIKLLNLNGERLVNLGYSFYGKNGETIPELLEQFWNKFKLKRFDALFSNTASRSLGDLKSILSARIKSLAYSYMNYFSCQKSSDFTDKLLEDSFVLSFKGASNSDLILLVSLFTFLYCENARMRAEFGFLQNLLLVEEAHLFLNRSISNGEVVTAEALLGNSFERMLAELRSKGIGLLLVDQSPSQLVQNVIANSGTKIIHQLAHRRDIEEISDSIGLSQMNELIYLPVGHCYQKIESGQPFKEIIHQWESI